MKVYISQRHYISNQRIFNKIRESQINLLQGHKSIQEAISDSVVTLFEANSELRKIIRTGNIIQIEQMEENQIIVAEFDARYDFEVILVIREDEHGNNYIVIPEDIIDDVMFGTEKVPGTVISDYEVINNFYDEDVDLIEETDFY